MNGLSNSQLLIDSLKIIQKEQKKMINAEESKAEYVLPESETAPFPVVKAPDFCEATNYYKEYWKIYLENEQLLTGLQEKQNDCLELQRKINAIQVLAV